MKIEKIRHSLAHILAAAVKEIYPDVKFGIGPAIENGFYYDFDFGKEKISQEDLEKIESKMKKPKELILALKRYIKEVIAELRKVTWTSRRELFVATLLVILLSAILSVFVGFFDFFFSHLLRLFLP